jgi:NAD(P)-dependent dehydrogenase (short-subunit alcohol dehydrogenase family)
MIITGAASGIGRATAVLVDKEADGLAETMATLTASATEAISLTADLADPSCGEVIAAKASDALGGIDAIISNAGYTAVSSLTDLGVESFDRMMAINARAAWLIGRAAHPALKQSRGAIVATASISSTVPTPPLGAYSASKAALVMLIQQMALEWGPDGIRCNAVSPGPTLTGMTTGVFSDLSDERQRRNRKEREAHLPLRRVGEAEDVARALLFLAGPGARQITGVNLVVDGGLSLALMPSVGGGSGHHEKH